MFEFEATRDQEPFLLEKRDRIAFLDTDADIRGISVIPWEEHCTECAMPACYTTCDLFEARADGKCRRFVRDAQLVPDLPTPQGYGLCVEFKRWAQLMAHGSARLVPTARARRVERLALRTDRFVSRLPGSERRFDSAGRLPQRFERRLKRWMSRGTGLAEAGRRPDYFLVEVLNPGSDGVALTLTIREAAERPERMAHQSRLELVPGFNRFKVDFGEIERFVDAEADLEIMLSPNLLTEGEEGLRLVFGSIGFVADAAYQANQREVAAPRTGPTEPAEARPLRQGGKGVKIVVWDLDNTVWDGVLVEDGPDGLELNPRIKEIMTELDRRGIVNSVVSKNDHDHAWSQLERFGLAELVVFPRISWEPKGAAVADVIADFNVGADTVVFVDDQPFEREQVATINPDVRVVDGRKYGGILELDVMNPSVSSESSKRREFYKNQHVRRGAESAHAGEYEDFLRKCEIQLTIATECAEKVERVHELVQRTNQMNFSGNRYERSEIDGLLRDSRFDAYVLSSTDRFGDYGIIGFALVERADARLVDLMFSCRIQSKRVEHAFLTFLLNRYRALGHQRFEARYRRSERNAASGRVFADLGFVEDGEVEGVSRLLYDLSDAVADEGVIDVRLEDGSDPA